MLKIFIIILCVLAGIFNVHIGICEPFVFTKLYALQTNKAQPTQASGRIVQQISRCQANENTKHFYLDHILFKCIIILNYIFQPCRRVWSYQVSVACPLLHLWLPFGKSIKILTYIFMKCGLFLACCPFICCWSTHPSKRL